MRLIINIGNVMCSGRFEFWILNVMVIMCCVFLLCVMIMGVLNVEVMIVFFLLSLSLLVMLMFILCILIQCINGWFFLQVVIIGLVIWFEIFYGECLLFGEIKMQLLEVVRFVGILWLIKIMLQFFLLCVLGLYLLGVMWLRLMFEFSSSVFFRQRFLDVMSNIFIGCVGGKSVNVLLLSGNILCVFVVRILIFVLSFLLLIVWEGQNCWSEFLVLSLIGLVLMSLLLVRIWSLVLI